MGFPGETKKDFDDTLELIQTVEFDNLFVFAYSDRPNTPAGRFKHKISQIRKSERLQAVLDLQAGITKQINASMKGTIQSVLIEGSSKKQDKDQVQWTGRTSGNKIVNFSADRGPDNKLNIRVGTIQTVSIERALAHSLRGRMLTSNSSQALAKGNQSYAA